ncbi:hypothetical protein [Yoonia sp.]|uniref:hypothetical protein n=1 Tax=Yoonia sp. TaxID=2212373 RepID=UPI0025FB0B9B|nr:hypothetical protein [Yoonia sp.]
MKRTQPNPLAAFFSAGGGQSVALAAGAGGSVSVWTEIAPHYAACLRLDNSNAGTRLSWRETLVMELRNIYPVGDFTLAGAWSQLQSSGSGLSGSYTGNRAVSTASLTATVTVTVDRAATYDLWVHFTGRTGGGYCRVEIDGAQTLVNEIDDPAELGFKAFSTYAAIDLQRRQSVKVASGLLGSHDITLRSGGAASPGGNAIMIEALAISGALSDPRILPSMWQPGTAYQTGDEVQYGGIYYAARADGTSGATPPGHTGGIGSDGALDWRADNRSTYPRFVSMDYASEREYAARCIVDGAATELGGQTHGNEVVQSRIITLDGNPWVPDVTGNGLSLGAQIGVTEATIWQHETGGAIADCQLTRTVTPGAVRHEVTVTGTAVQASFDWLYAGMVPMVRWDGEAANTVVDTVAVADATSVSLADYAGASGVSLDYPGARQIGISATFDGATLRYGHEAGPLPVFGNLVNQFDTFLRPNLDAASASGSLDWKAKAYVKGGAAGGLVLGAGDVLGFFSRHVLRID